MAKILSIFNLSNLTLLTALSLSAIAAWYSILGLVAIFAAAVIPIIIMGGALEFAKVITTVWLHRYWDKIGWKLKLYLVPAVISLALLTSMGIFGFLSKAHMDQSIVSGDSQAKLSLLDEKIKTQRDNIEIARKALQQMDAQVDARLSRGDSEQSAERAVQIRRQQASERNKLQKEIGDAQKVIAQLNEERAPIAAENRKIEAEVGPIKYIAALIYGDNPDSNLLERAVRWVIILIVLVFDPLALTLVIAASTSKRWDKENVDTIPPYIVETTDKPTLEELAEIDKEYEAFKTEQEVDKFTEQASTEIIQEIEKLEEKPHHPDTHPYLNQGFKYPKDFEPHPPLVGNIDPVQEKVEVQTVEEPKVTEAKVTDPIVETQKPLEIKTEGVTKENPIVVVSEDYVSFEGKHMRKEALKELRPDLFKINADNNRQSNTHFGTEFPKISSKGDIFVRVDALPNRAFKFDGSKWIEINKITTDSYLHDNQYIKYLIGKIDSGEYDIELLTDNEKTLIEDHLRNQNT
jgi:hypothetical protein